MPPRDAPGPPYGLSACEGGVAATSHPAAGSGVNAGARRCPQRMASQIQCELRCGHRSVHAARDGEVILHWRSADLCDEDARRVSLDWAVEGRPE